MDRIFRLKRVVILTTLFSFQQKNLSFRISIFPNIVGNLYLLNKAVSRNFLRLNTHYKHRRNRYYRCNCSSGKPILKKTDNNTSDIWRGKPNFTTKLPLHIMGGKDRKIQENSGIFVNLRHDSI